MAKTTIREGQAKDSDFLSESEAASTTSPSGASLIGVEDTGGYYAGTEIETILQDVGGNYTKITRTAGVPATTPNKTGDIYVDTSNGNAYVATGTSSSDDWERIDGGSGGGTNFASDTFTNTTTITFTHNLNVQFVSITVIDGNDEAIIPKSISYDSTTQATITLEVAQSGTVIAIGGSGSANQVGFKHIQSSAAGTWTINHGLGVEPVYKFFNNSNVEINPDQVTNGTSTTTTIFGTSQAGYAILIGSVTSTSVVVTKTAMYGNGDLDKPGVYGLGIFNATTTNTDDSISIKKHDGTSLSSSNKGYVVLPSATSGQLTTFEVTSDVTIDLTGAHWGAGGNGDLTDAILRVLAINDNGTLKWGVAYLGNRKTLVTTDTTATGTSATNPESVLCTSAIASSSNTSLDVFWFKVNFDDTGGASEDLWTVQSGVGDLNFGSADGYWQPWNPTYPIGFSSPPSTNLAEWTQYGLDVSVRLQTGDGTSNATTFQITMPLKISDDGGFNLSRPSFAGRDNSSALTTNILIRNNADDSNVCDLYTDPAFGTWTGSGGKGVQGIMNFKAKE